MSFNGLHMNLGNLSLLSRAKSRSISAENFGGEKGKGGMATEGEGANAARDLGQTFKVSPCVKIAANTTFTVAEIDGPGAIQQVWFTTAPEFWRHLILRIYWDDEPTPSVETPIGDFFLNGWCSRSNIISLPIGVNPAGGFNCYFEMPFRKKARITVENMRPEDVTLFYQVNYTLTEIPDDCAYFHAQFRRTNPLAYKDDYTILDGVKGFGHYIGTYIAWGANNDGWWGEGEIKFFMDGDTQFPTICGTGTEDYFGGAWCFVQKDGKYEEYSNLYTGFQMIAPDGLFKANTRFSMYRFHITDPVRFEEDLRVTIQALGWRSHGRYLPLQDDIASVAFWYQAEPHAAFPKLPDYDGLEVI